MNDPVHTVRAWQKLPELPIPQEGCRVERVVHLSVTYVPPDVWAVMEFPLPADGLLATVTLLREGREERWRLPHILGNWAYSILAYRVQGVPVLPTDVEFSTKNGRPSVFVRLPE